MTKEELAAKLNGREYGKEISKIEKMQAEEFGLVVVFGYSDDNIEFTGAIDDEFGCCNGGTAYLHRAGLFENCEDECQYSKAAKAKCAQIRAVWDSGGYSWTYKTEIPHAVFDILEDGEKYCRGIVFDMMDLPSLNN